MSSSTMYMDNNIRGVLDACTSDEKQSPLWVLTQLQTYLLSYCPAQELPVPQCSVELAAQRIDSFTAFMDSIQVDEERICRSVQDGILYLCALRSPYALHPASQMFPQRCLTLKVFNPSLSPSLAISLLLSPHTSFFC